jgi:hypothetical protein
MIYRSFKLRLRMPEGSQAKRQPLTTSFDQGACEMLLMDLASDQLPFTGKFKRTCTASTKQAEHARVQPSGSDSKA